MPDYRTHFGQYLKKEDVPKPIRVNVANVTCDEVFNEAKLVAHLVEFDKSLVLNKGNCDVLAEIAGTGDYDEWGGIEVGLYTDPNVSFSGKKVGGLRLKAVKPRARAKPESALELEPLDEDSIPF
jgi:hypothetical protein